MSTQVNFISFIELNITKKGNHMKSFQFKKFCSLVWPGESSRASKVGHICSQHNWNFFDIKGCEFPKAIMVLD